MVELPPETVDLRARFDTGDLEFVLDNLLGNAVKAVQDEARRRIRVRVLRKGEVLECWVEDSGAGVAEDQARVLFQETLVQQRNRGLGLPRSHQVVRLFDGSLDHVGRGELGGAGFVLGVMGAA